MVNSRKKDIIVLDHSDFIPHGRKRKRRKKLVDKFKRQVIYSIIM
jgi:hypothetical protein